MLPGPSTIRTVRSPCVPEKLGSEGRAWAPEAPMEHRASRMSTWGGRSDAGRGAGATHIECRLCALNTVQTVPLK